MSDDDKPTTPADLEPIHAQLKSQDIRMGVIETQLADNNTLTAEIKEILDTAKAGFKVIGGLGVALQWAGKIAAALVALWGFFFAVTHAGPPK